MKLPTRIISSLIATVSIVILVYRIYPSISFLTSFIFFLVLYGLIRVLLALILNYTHKES